MVSKELSQNNFLNFALKTKKVLENQGLSAGVVKLTSEDGAPSGIQNPRLRTKVAIILSSKYAQTNPMRRHSSASEGFKPIWIHMCTL